MPARDEAGIDDCLKHKAIPAPKNPALSLAGPDVDDFGFCDESLYPTKPFSIKLNLSSCVVPSSTEDLLYGHSMVRQRTRQGQMGDGELDITLEELMEGQEPPPIPGGHIHEACVVEGVKTAEGEISRALTAADIVLLSHQQAGDTSPKPLKKLRDSHHWVARLLARGMTDVEVSVATGYSTSRISILKNDPSFKQILHQYRELADDVQVDLVGRLKHFVGDSVGELMERFDEKPEEFSNKALLDMIVQLGDRAGLAPTQNVNAKVLGLVVTEDNVLDRIKETVNGLAKGKVISGTPKKASSSGEGIEMGKDSG